MLRKKINLSTIVFCLILVFVFALLYVESIYAEEPAVYTLLEHLPPCLNFDDVSDFIGEYAIVMKDESCGVIDTSGNVLFMTSDYSISSIESSPGYFSAMLSSEIIVQPKFGIVNMLGEIVIPLEYDYPIGFTNGLALVCLEGKYGVYDIEGSFNIAPQYDRISGLIQDFAVAKRNDIWYCINKEGEELFEFDADDIFLVSPYAPEMQLLNAKKNDKWGAVNFSGEIIIPFEYDAIKLLSDDIIWVMKEELWGAVDMEGEIMFEPSLVLSSAMRSPFYGQFFNGIAIVQNENEQWGCVNKKGEIIVDFGTYDNIIRDADHSQFIRVNQSKYWGLIDIEGKSLINLEYEVLWPFFADNRAIAYRDDVWLIVDSTGQVIAHLPIDLGVRTANYNYGGTTADAFWNGIARIPQGNMFSYIDRNGNSLGAATYERANLFRLSEYASIKANGLWGIFKVVLTYDNVTEVNLPNVQTIVLTVGSSVITLNNAILPEPSHVPIIIEERVMLPFRYLIETILTGNAEYDEASHSVTADISGHTFIMTVDSSEFMFDEETMLFDSPPRRHDNQVFIPLRIFDMLYDKVEWDSGGVKIIFNK